MAGNVQRVLLGSGFNIRTVTTKARVGVENGSPADCGACEAGRTDVGLVMKRSNRSKYFSCGVWEHMVDH